MLPETRVPPNKATFGAAPVAYNKKVTWKLQNLKLTDSKLKS
jgi:hypothetical protein